MADERTEKQKVQEITDKLEEGLKELFESEKYKTYLSTMSKFHNYSFNNTLLITMQKPEATLVAGYQVWQKNFERHVNKGEKAIRILAPAPYKIKEERDKLDPVTGEMMFDKNGMPQKEQVEVTIPAFRAVSVFDVSQTDGKPIPELETQELLSTVEGYEDFVQALMNVAPVPIGFEDIPGDSKGYFYTEEKRIAVQENMSESQTLKTMVHEVAHDEVDLLSGNRIDLEILEHIPSITSEPKAMEVIAELVAKLPEMEIDGVMSEDMEAKVWEKRMPDLTPAEQLAVEIDRFSHDYDIYSYRNNNPNMTESVSEISEMIVQGNTEPIADWLNEVISEGALPDEMQRAKVLLEKLAEYKPLAKIEEMEEQNYNMIDNVLNNGAEKAQREANKKDQEQPAVKVSLKARLAEKRAQVAGSGQEHEVQENTKKNQREI